MSICVQKATNKRFLVLEMQKSQHERDVSAPLRVAKVGVFPSSSGKRMIPLRIWVVPLPKISPHVTTALDM